MIMAIDPGTYESAYCLMRRAIWGDYKLVAFSKVKNEELLQILESGVYKFDRLVIEKIASYGMPVGSEVFDTCEWIGRFKQVVGDCDYIYRKEEKMNLCGTMKANDKMIRRALIERFATFDKKYGKGTLKKPDYFYGVHNDIWSAIAVAVTYLDKEGENGTEEV